MIAVPNFPLFPKTTKVGCSLDLLKGIVKVWFHFGLFPLFPESTLV